MKPSLFSRVFNKERFPVLYSCLNKQNAPFILFFVYLFILLLPCILLYPSLFHCNIEESHDLNNSAERGNLEYNLGLLNNTYSLNDVMHAIISPNPISSILESSFHMLNGTVFMQWNLVNKQPPPLSYNNWVKVDLATTFPAFAPYLHANGEYHEHHLRVFLECAVNHAVFKKDASYQYTCDEFLNRASCPKGKDWYLHYYTENILRMADKPGDVLLRLQTDAAVLKFVHDLE